MMRPAGGASEVMNWISPHPAMQDATHTTCSVPAFSHKGRRYLVGLYDWNSAWMEWTVKRISPQYLVPLPPEQQLATPPPPAPARAISSPLSSNPPRSTHPPTALTNT
ncbi:uncharacterized protein [Miscanthus floridulus]|uniref:uncharacterized protein isoform X1 n=1 Tax=Miscanthus floridulus TaxID=154761 RepID=UPI0034590A3F